MFDDKITLLNLIKEKDIIFGKFSIISQCILFIAIRVTTSFSNIVIKCLLLTMPIYYLKNTNL